MQVDDHSVVFQRTLQDMTTAVVPEAVGNAEVVPEVLGVLVAQQAQLPDTQASTLPPSQACEFERSQNRRGSVCIDCESRDSRDGDAGIAVASLPTEEWDRYF